MSDEDGKVWHLEDIDRQVLERFGGTPERDEFLGLSNEKQQAINRDETHRLHPTAQEIAGEHLRLSLERHERDQKRQAELGTLLKARAARSRAVAEAAEESRSQMESSIAGIQEAVAARDERERKIDRRATIALWVSVATLAVAILTLVVSVFIG